VMEKFYNYLEEVHLRDEFLIDQEKLFKKGEALSDIVIATLIASFKKLIWSIQFQFRYYLQ